MNRLHYPNFDVLAEKDHWDKFSRAVVLERLKPSQPSFLNATEVRTLRTVVENLLYESREDVLNFVVFHVDRQLASPIGESERKADVPPQGDLLRRGLNALDAFATTNSGKPLSECQPEFQAKMLQDLQQSMLSMTDEFADIPQKDLFKKLLLLAVDALASHPIIWSEMGFAGPAYPRGYYRIEHGLTDPWEAKSSKSTQKGEDDATN